MEVVDQDTIFVHLILQCQAGRLFHQFKAHRHKTENYVGFMQRQLAYNYEKQLSKTKKTLEYSSKIHGRA